MSVRPPPLASALLPLLFFLLVAGPAAAQAGGLSGTLSALSVRADGAAHVAAPLVALLQEQARDGLGGADPAFRLQARRLLVQVDSVDPSAHDGLVLDSANAFPTTTSSRHEDAVVEGLANRPGYRWNLFSTTWGQPIVELSTDCADGAPSPVDALTRRPLVANGPGGRGDTVRDVAATLRWGCLDGATLRVTGDFQLSLWAWNATLTDDGASRLLASGQDQSSAAPEGAPDLSRLVSHSREVYLLAEDATLVTTLRGSGHFLHTGPATLAAPSLRLQGATGRLDLAGETVGLDSSAVRLDGELQARLAGSGTGRPFRASVAGVPSAATVDGRPLAIPVAAPGGGLAWLWTLGPVAVGAALAVPATLLARRRFRTGSRTESLVELARERLEEGDLAGSARLAERAIGDDPGDPEAHFLHALGLARLGRPAKALAAHTRADAILRRLIRRGTDLATLRAENAFEAARCCMRLAVERPAEEEALHQQAVGWLKAAVQLQRIFLREAELDPLLSDLAQGLGQGAKAAAWWDEP